MPCDGMEPGTKCLKDICFDVSSRSGQRKGAAAIGYLLGRVNHESMAGVSELARLKTGSLTSSDHMCTAKPAGQGLCRHGFT